MSMQVYGDFGLLPREIRDQIYEEYFSMWSWCDLQHFKRVDEAQVALHIAGPNAALLRTSRALYQEALPFWEKNFKGKRLARVTINFGSRRVIDQALPEEPASEFCIVSRSLHLRCGATHRRPDVTFVFPNFGFLADRKDLIDDNHMAKFRATILMAHITARPLHNGMHLGLVVEDPTWPLPEPSQPWHERLHRGMTRRSQVIKRNKKAECIARQIKEILLRWRPNTVKVSFEFGETLNHMGIDGGEHFRSILTAVKQKNTPMVRVEF